MKGLLMQNNDDEKQWNVSGSITIESVMTKEEAQNLKSVVGTIYNNCK